MEITVKVEKLLEPMTFRRKDGAEGHRYGFLGKTVTGQYDKQIKFDVMKEDLWERAALRVGGTYSVSFELESREWNGKYFTSCNVWKVVTIDLGNGMGVSPIAAAPAPQSVPTAEKPSNDLPF